MIGLLRRIFAGKSAGPPSQKPAKPPIPQQELDAFERWFAAQTKPAVALLPAEDQTVEARGTRIGGPAWLGAGEEWPTDRKGQPLDLIAQLDMADCTSLANYPRDGVIQFFIGRDEFFGMDLDHLAHSNFLVRLVVPDANGRLQPSPPLEVPPGELAADYSPLGDSYRREGLPLRAEPFIDRMDASVMEACSRLETLWQTYETSALDDIVEDEKYERRMDHHTGGYPAYTQTDIRFNPAFADYDHVLLRLTSDDDIMWGDSGEAVFLIRSQDLAKGDFSRVVYSWDCC